MHFDKVSTLTCTAADGGLQGWHPPWRGPACRPGPWAPGRPRSRACPPSTPTGASPAPLPLVRSRLSLPVHALAQHHPATVGSERSRNLCSACPGHQAFSDLQRAGGSRCPGTTGVDEFTLWLCVSWETGCARPVANASCLFLCMGGGGVIVTQGVCCVQL